MLSIYNTHTICGGMWPVYLRMSRCWIAMGSTARASARLAKLFRNSRNFIRGYRESPLGEVAL